MFIDMILIASLMYVLVAWLLYPAYCFLEEMFDFFIRPHSKD